MKKKLLCLMITMVMGFAAIAPTAAVKTIKFSYITIENFKF